MSTKVVHPYITSKEDIGGGKSIIVGTRTRVSNIESEGIRGLDSLHLACAEASEAGFFITCDDKIFKRYNGKIEIKNPVEFIITILKEDKK